MAKSPMSELVKRPRGSTPALPNTSVEVDDLSMSLSFRLSYSQQEIKFNFRDLCYVECDSNRELAVPCRTEAIRKLYKKIKSDTSSDSTRYKYCVTAKRYIALCDSRSLNPFDKSGIEGILGLNGELSRQEKLANEPMPFLFSYPNGAELGIKTSTANSFSAVVKTILHDAGCSSSVISKYARRESQLSNDGFTIPHTDGEMDIILARVQAHFFSLANGILEYFDKHGRVPERLNGVSIGVSGREGEYEELTIDMGSRVDKPSNYNLLPFNQMMVSGYILFCYYTSFNDAQIKDIRHPISIVTNRREGRTERYVKVKGYKARKHDDVYAYFVGIESGDLKEVEAEVNQAGFIIGDALKRGKHKHTDGLKFIKTLARLSKLCNPEKHGRLFYCLDAHGDLKSFSFDRVSDQLIVNLGLLAEDRSSIANYLSDVICRYLDKGEWERVKVFKDSAGFCSVSREVITKPLKVTRVHSLVYTFVRSLTDIPLKGALIPLTYTESTIGGNVEVIIKYEDGSVRSFDTPKRYIETLKRIEARANQFNPMHDTPRGRKVTRPAYFLPMGVRSETYQWDGHEMPVRRKFLSELGITHGKYLLSTGSRRLRVNISDDLYSNEDHGKQARDVLQHSRETQAKKYVNGHPIDNLKQFSQGLNVIGQIAEGETLEGAKSNVREQLGIKVLSYDEWKQKNSPSNPNGVSCNGKIALEEGKNEHYAAQKFALENGIIEGGKDITCYQYDLCPFCKNMQLIDEPYSVYKLLSFIDSLYDSIEKMPERVEYFQRRINRFENLLDLLPEETLQQADDMFEENGRYFLFRQINTKG